MTELDLAARLAVAALAGLAAGIERERSGHATGPNARFAGVRTFFLFGLAGGTAGLLAASGFALGAAMLLGAGGAFAVAAYLAATRRPAPEGATDPALDGTTEVAALAVLAIAMLAGLGHLGVAAGAAALMTLALGEKTRIQGWVRRLGEREFAAALQFAVLALVVLPLLPRGPLPQLAGIMPRSLWTIVLAICGINFAAYVAVRLVGASRGSLVTGLLGGLFSSTLTTLTFARRSREQPELAGALATGALAACSVMPLRVLAVGWLLEPQLAAPLRPYAFVTSGVGALVVALLRRRDAVADGIAPAAPKGSPLRLAASLRLAALFQLGFWLTDALREHLHPRSLVATGALLGLIEMDMLAATMARVAADDLLAVVAAQAVAAGIAADTALKLGLVLALGAPAYRRRAGVGLALLFGATLAVLALALRFPIAG